MLLKIGSADFLLLAKAIARNHPYEVPCIVNCGIAAGFQPYLDWIKESTDRSLEGCDRRSNGAPIPAYGP